MPPLSILDLAFVPEVGTPGDALRNTLDLAQHAEKWGYRRFWLAEHHNMVGIASAATAVVISYVAAGTRTIRVGAGWSRRRCCSAPLDSWIELVRRAAGRDSRSALCLRVAFRAGGVDPGVAVVSP